MKRPLGQHFLFDQNILKKIINCSHLTAEDTVVEIGPGPGAMTLLLAGHVNKVIAIEIDRRLILKLEKIFSKTENVEIISADALKFPYETIKDKFRVVANIPYYITTPLLFRLLEFRKNISSMTLLLQKEVAKRITASPGGKDYGVLSIGVQIQTKPKMEFLVPKGAFSPPPNVDSAVVHFEISPQLPYKIKDREFFLKLVRTAFSQRRKTIANSLKSFKDIKGTLIKTGINSTLRPEVLSIEDFIRLSDNLQNNQ